MSTEDQRVAGNISITLSSQLMAAALAMLAIEGVVLSLIYDKRESSYWFIVLIILAALCFIGSILVAGKGITIIRNKGYNGTWEFKSSRCYFNWQAILCILGLILFFASPFFTGVSKEIELKNEIILLKQEVKNLKSEIETIKKESNKPPKKESNKGL
jgi:hypothetical protein